MTDTQAEILPTATLLAAIREGLAKPFADPVEVRSLIFTRAEARAAERVLSRLLVSMKPPASPMTQPGCGHGSRNLTRDAVPVCGLNLLHAAEVCDAD